MENLFNRFFSQRSAAGVGKGTLKRIRSNAKLFQSWLEAEGIERITPEILTDYIAHLYSRTSLLPGKSDTLKKSTIRKHVDFLITFGRCSGIDTSGIIRPIPPVRDFPSLSRHQIDVMLALVDRVVVRHRRRVYKALFTLLLDTGLRASEALSLRFTDINMYLRQITVIGKGDKQRRVPFGELTLAALRALNEGEYVFVGRDGHLTDSTVRSTLARIKSAAPEMFDGVRLSPHTLRHTFARHWLLNGGDIYSLMRLLGHNDIKMTARYLYMDNQDITKLHAKHSIFT